MRLIDDDVLPELRESDVLEEEEEGRIRLSNAFHLADCRPRG